MSSVARGSAAPPHSARTDRPQASPWPPALPRLQLKPPPTAPLFFPRPRGVSDPTAPPPCSGLQSLPELTLQVPSLEAPFLGSPGPVSTEPRADTLSLPHKLAAQGARRPSGRKRRPSAHRPLTGSSHWDHPAVARIFFNHPLTQLPSLTAQEDFPERRHSQLRRRVQPGRVLPPAGRQLRPRAPAREPGATPD